MSGESRSAGEVKVEIEECTAGGPRSEVELEFQNAQERRMNSPIGANAEMQLNLNSDNFYCTLLYLSSFM